jgi:hypothetical protein
MTRGVCDFEPRVEFGGPPSVRLHVPGQPKGGAPRSSGELNTPAKAALKLLLVRLGPAQSDDRTAAPWNLS